MNALELSPHQVMCPNCGGPTPIGSLGCVTCFHVREDTAAESNARRYAAMFDDECRVTDVESARRVMLLLLADRDRTIDALRADVESADEQRRTAEEDRRTAVARLEAFKVLVAEATRDFDGGCVAGKTEFLESIGLEYPHQSWQVSITYTFTGEEPSEYDIGYAVAQAVDCDDSPDVSVYEVG